MSWLAKRRLRSVLTESLWPAPVAAMFFAMMVSPVFMWIDRRANLRLLNHTPEGARELLAAIAPASLTFIGLILSTLLLSVQLAASQLSPRLIAGLIARPQVKVCLAIFSFTYAYCAGVLGRIETDHVPHLPMLVALLSTLATVTAGLYLIDYMAKELRPVRMLVRTAEMGREIIARIYPHRLSEGHNNDEDDGRAPAALPTPPPQAFVTVPNSSSGGALLAVNARTLVALAEASGRVIELVPQVGDFVSRDEPLFHVHPDLGTIAPADLQAAVAFGQERTPEQDPSFAFRIIVDVGSRALSPGTNDPTTAVLAIDQLHFLLRHVGLRHLDANHLCDRGGNVRLIFRTPGWEDYVLLAVSEIRLFGSGSMQIARRLKAMLENLCELLPEARRPPLREQLQLLKESVRRGFDDVADRVHAETADLQGVGSSCNAKAADTPAPLADSPKVPAVEMASPR